MESSLSDRMSRYSSLSLVARAQASIFLRLAILLVVVGLVGAASPPGGEAEDQPEHVPISTESVAQARAELEAKTDELANRLNELKTRLRLQVTPPTSSPSPDLVGPFTQRLSSEIQKAAPLKDLPSKVESLGQRIDTLASQVEELRTKVESIKQTLARDAQGQTER